MALGELLYGAHKSRQKKQTLQQVREFLLVCHLLVPGEATADFYGQVKADLARQGTPFPQNDILIAAAAIEHGLPLASRDAHFVEVNDRVTGGW